MQVSTRQSPRQCLLSGEGRTVTFCTEINWTPCSGSLGNASRAIDASEARNALSRALFFNRPGEIRDRSFEQQRYRASGLNLMTAAIVLWNTVYLQRAVAALREQGRPVDDALLQHFSPLGWDHVNLTGDYVWRRNAKVGARKFRLLRPLAEA